MDCDRCVYKNKKFRNKCALLESRTVSWDCTVTKEDYEIILDDMLEYYIEKFENTDEVIEQINYRKQIDMVKKQIDVVQGWRYQ